MVRKGSDQWEGSDQSWSLGVERHVLLDWFTSLTYVSVYIQHHVSQNIFHTVHVSKVL